MCRAATGYAAASNPATANYATQYRAAATTYDYASAGAAAAATAAAAGATNAYQYAGKPVIILTLSIVLSIFSPDQL